MNYLDLALVSLVGCFAYVGFRRGGYRAFVSLGKSILAFALAFLAQSRLVDTRYLGWIGSQLHQRFTSSLVLPAGPGTTIEGALHWLQELELPEALARSIQNAWVRQDTIDVKLLAHYAGQVLAAAAVNAMCFVALFLVARWVINQLSKLMIRALPPQAYGKARIAGVSLGLIESMIICAILLALLAPFVATSHMPLSLVEYYQGSRIVGYLHLVVRFVGAKLYFLS